MTNFDFLKDKPEYRAFSKDCVDAEAAFKSSYDSCVKLVRTALDAAIKWVYVADKKNPPNNLFELIEQAGFDKNLADKLHYCRKAGNAAIHNEKEFSAREAEQCLKNLFDFVQWLDNRYGKNFTPRTFNAVNSLQTELFGLKLNTPIFAASGTFGFGEEFENFVDLKQLGGVMVKCITLKPRRGNDGVRITETPSGMLNAIGLENPGVEVFLKKILPRIKDKMNVVVNVSGSSVDDYGRLAKMLDVDGVAAIELNISCPNVKDGGIIFGTDESYERGEEKYAQARYRQAQPERHRHYKNCPRSRKRGRRLSFTDKYANGHGNKYSHVATDARQRHGRFVGRRD